MRKGLVRNEREDEGCVAEGFVWRTHLEAVGARGLGARVLRDCDPERDPAIAQILRLRASLVAVAQDRDALAVQAAGIGVLVEEDPRGSVSVCHLPTIPPRHRTRAEAAHFAAIVARCHSKDA